MTVKFCEWSIVLTLCRHLHSPLNKVLEVAEDKEELRVGILDLWAESNVQEAGEARLYHKTED